MSFSRSTQLKSHKICTHQEIRSFECVECGKHFGTAAILKLHSMTHTGERPHACDMCGRTFSLLNNLNVHKRNVHYGVRSHSCQECGKKFACKRNLLYHLGTHSTVKPYACDQCNKVLMSYWIVFIKCSHVLCSLQIFSFLTHFSKVFPQQENLIRHRKVIHSNARSHVCELCDRSFSNSSNLKRHIIQHTKIKKAFLCNVCNISFRSEIILFKHQQKFHSTHTRNHRQ